MSEFSTDYSPGDEPVSVGTLVEYKGTAGIPGGVFQIVFTEDPQNHPHSSGFPVPVREAYPDGKAYLLFRDKCPKKMGNRSGNEVQWVRRTSFRVVEEEK